MKIKTILFLSACIVGLLSCEKAEINPERIASLNVVNAGVNAGTVQVNHFGEPIVWANYGSGGSVSYGSSRVFSVSANTPTPVVIVPSSDTLTTLYNETIDFDAGEIYSLYLIGTSPGIESMLVEETDYPQNDPDKNVVYVRFINLSPGSPDVNITISTSPTVKEFSDIGYKESTTFKEFNADGITSLVVQVRNASTDALITSSTVNLSTTSTASRRYHPLTLVLRGVVGGSPSAGVTQVLNY